MSSGQNPVTPRQRRVQIDPGDEDRSEALNILYVDDNVFDRELVRDALEMEHGGFRVTEAACLEEFEARLEEDSYDLVLSDFHIRGFERLSVIDMVRASCPNTPVVIVTGTGSEQAAVEAMKRGAADYVIKTPQHIQRLPGTILAALDRWRLQEAHHRAEDAQRFLVEASAILASSLDYEKTLAALACLAVPALADFCAVQVVDDRSAGGVVVARVDPGGERLVHEAWRPCPPAPTWPEAIAKAMRSGQPLRVAEVPDSLLSTLVDGAEQLKLLRGLALSSFMVVPLLARGRSLGFLSFGWIEGERRHGQEDPAVALELGGRVALAVDNAKLYREAREAIRMRDEFLAVAAHELKTPVTSLKGFAQLTRRLIEREGSPDLAQVHQAMQVIDRQSDRLTHLMSRLLDVSRVEARRLEVQLGVVDVVHLVREVVERLRANTNGHPVELGCPPSALALVDGLRLEQVLTNLLDNAVKFSPGGEPIEVEVRVPSPDTICLCVRDHGIGIPLERRQGIFDRFYQAHGEGAFGGMGLGLYISRHIVELHGGSIEAEFPLDGGTRFVVTLPNGLDNRVERDEATALDKAA